MFLGFRTPDFAQDVAMRQDAAGMSNEQAQKRVFGRGSFISCPARVTTRAVRSTTRSPFLKTEISSVGPGFALRGTQAREQFRRAEWLGDVIVRAGIERGDFAGFIITHRQNKHRRFAPFAQPFQDFEAIHVGQAEIEQNDGRLAIGDFDQSLLTGLGFVHLIVLRLRARRAGAGESALRRR